MTTRKRFGIQMALAVLLGCGFFTNAQALELNIDNAGFESVLLPDGRYSPTIAGWETSGTVGTWDPNWRYFGGRTPDGENVGYIHYGNSYIEQTIEDYTLTAGTLLNISGLFGWREGVLERPSFDFALLIGDVVLTHGSVDLTPGSFASLTLTYAVDSLNPYLGLNPTIRISNTSSIGGNPQLLIDDIRAENNAVPEPSTLLLLGAGILGLGAMRRRQSKD